MRIAVGVARVFAMSEDDDSTEDIVTEEMLWERIPETQGLDRANTYYELSARIYARGQYDEALALAETARDIYAGLCCTFRWISSGLLRNWLQPKSIKTDE